MGNKHSRTPLGLDGSIGKAAERLGLAQHQDLDAPRSIGNQEKTVSVKPADPRFISHKQPSDCLVIPSSDPLPYRAFFSASPVALSSWKTSTVSRSSSPRTARNDGSSPVSTICARQPSGEGLSDQHTEGCQRTPKSSSGDNRAFGVKSRRESCGPAGNGKNRLTKDGAWQQALDSTTTTTTRVRTLCTPSVSDERLLEKQDEEEDSKQASSRVLRGDHRGSHRVRGVTNATRGRAQKGTPPVINGLGEGKSSRRVGNGEVVSIVRRSVESDRERSTGATFYRKRRVINTDHSDDCSISTVRNWDATSGRVSNEGIRERPKKGRDITRTTARGIPSAVNNEEQLVDTASSLLRLPGADESAEGEVLSVSSANSGIAQEELTVSASHFLPPMDVAAPGGGAESILEDLSIEDSAASASLASSSDKNGSEVGAGTEGEDVDDGGRGKRGRPSSRHRGSLDTFVRISKDGEGECFQVQELSELDEETLEKGTSLTAAAAAGMATGVVTSSIVALPRTALNMVTPTTVDFGHQRAALELKNLMLEREVEQLKACLRSMGGDDVDFRRYNLQCRHRARPQQGRRGGSAMGALGSTAFIRKEKSASIPGILRSVASFSLPKAPPSIARRYRGGDDVVDGSKREKAVHARELTLLDNHRGEAEISAAGGSHDTRSGEDAADADVTQPSSLSSPRKCDHRFSDSRTLEGLEVPGGVPAMATASRDSHACFSSHTRHLRTTTPPSSESASGVAGAGSDTARVGAAAGGTNTLPARGKAFKEKIISRSESFDVAIRTQRGQEERNSKIGSGHPANHDTPSMLFVEKKPLRRAGAEKADRRRKVLEKSRTSKVPGYLVMGRRRSTGTMISTHLAPASITEHTAVNAVHGRDGGGGAGRSRNNLYPLPLQILAGRKRRQQAGHKEDATTSQLAEGDERKCAPRRPARRGIVGSASPSAVADPMTAAAAVTAAAGEVATVPFTTDKDEHARGSPRLREGGGEGAGRQRAGISGPAVTNRAVKDGGSGVLTQVVAAKMATNSSLLNAANTVATSKASGLSSAAVTPSKAKATTERRETVQVLAPPRVVQQEGRERWPATLDARWAEVEFVLCRRVDCEKSFKYTAEATKEGLVFIDKLEKKAQELGVLKGQLSRWLLPFNVDTSVEEQQAATPRGLQDSLQACLITSVANGEGIFTEEEARYLTDGARKVRQLVRLKIADDNDLNTAKEALIAMAGFFDSLAEEAARRGGTATAFDILQERRATSPISRPPPLPSIPRSSSTAAGATSSSCAGANEHAAVAISAAGASSKVSNPNNGRTVLPTASAGTGPLPTGKIESRPDHGGGGGSGGEVKRRNGGGSFPPPPTTTTTIGTAVSVSERAVTHTKNHAIGCVDFSVAGVEEKNAFSTSGVERTIAPLDRAHTGLAVAASCQPTISTVAVRDLAGEIAIERAAERGAGSGAKCAESGDTCDRSFGSRRETTTVVGAEPATDVSATASPRIDVEQTPRTTGTGEIRGVAPRGSFEQLKQRGKKA